MAPIGCTDVRFVVTFSQTLNKTTDTAAGASRGVAVYSPADITVPATKGWPG